MNCFLLENDPPEQHGKPIACTQCWNALCAERDSAKDQVEFIERRTARGVEEIRKHSEKLRGNVTTLLGVIGKIAGLEIDAPGIKAIEIALKALVEFGETEGGEALKAEADWQRFIAAGKGSVTPEPKPTN